jgi:hypothetical protein
VQTQLASREAEPPDESGAALCVVRLPRDWLVGRDCDIGGPLGRPIRVELVALHPAFGVALLSVLMPVEGAEEILRHRLSEARFGSMFSGHLPILNGTFSPGAMPRLVPVLMEAFGAEPALDLAGGDAWAATFTRLVVPSGVGWTDNLEGLPPLVGMPDDGRTAWRRVPADVVPLRRVIEPQPKGADPEQNLPLPDPVPLVHRRWPWVACAAYVVAMTVLVLWLFGTSEITPDHKPTELAVASTIPDHEPNAVPPPGAEFFGADAKLAPVTSVATPPIVVATVDSAQVATPRHVMGKPNFAPGKPARVQVVAKPKAPLTVTKTPGRRIEASKRVQGRA